MKFHIAGSLEFFEYHVVHAASRFHQRSSQNGYGTAFFHLAGGSEEFFRLVERSQVQSSRKSSARGRNYHVIGSRESCYAVQQDHNVPAVFYQSLRSGQHHFGYFYVMLRKFVKGGVDHIPGLQGTLHICDFFRPFIYQKNY